MPCGDALPWPRCPGVTRCAAILLAVVTLVGAGACGGDSGGESEDSAAPPATTLVPPTLLTLPRITTSTSLARRASSSTSTSVAPAVAFIRFTDDETGFTLQYPAEWRARPPSGDVRLTALDAQGNGLQVRIHPITAPADRSNIVAYKTATDAIVFSGDSVRLVQYQLVTVNDRLTHYYVYSFQDSATGRRAINAHYFIFEGSRMFSLVLQAVPEERFAELAATFDAIAESFVVQPR